MSTNPPRPADVLIIGGGPSGLALAIALADRGLASTVIDAQEAGVLADPTPDGRDIALTHRAQAILRELGLWQRLPADEIAPLREAAVYNGDDPRPLRFDPRGSGEDELGHLVANHVIRRASWQAVQGRPEITLHCGARVTGLRVDDERATVTLRNAPGGDEEIAALLVVAADSRFSETRRRAGIGAQMRDFGRSVIVCRMTHSQPHGEVAQECFHTGHTLALLPMNGGQSSIVLTLPSDRAAAMLQWPGERYAEWVQTQLAQRVGTMALVGARHLYPLVAVYAHRFAAPRVALVGDAAVGMHPVTAHGYNFGLYGVEALADLLADARRAGRDPGSAEVVGRYDERHRRETFPIYHGTNAIVGLFTDDRPPARLLRQAVIRVADRLPPLKTLITERLTRSTAQPWPPLPPGLAALWRG
jgi:ubiquinone biosynthesis UbiH/UbiF/VisC/COQ6 family hydroxylase